MIEENPGHSAWYIERFRSMAAEGQDLDGEARFVDAMIPRGARILDAGCGPGRVGGRLAALGHHVVGVDIDPELIAAAEGDHPGAIWLAPDLAVLDLAADGVSERFDVIVSAGNVMTFLDPATRRDVLYRLLVHLAPAGSWLGSVRDGVMTSTSSSPMPPRSDSATSSGFRHGICAPSTRRRRRSWSRSVVDEAGCEAVEAIRDLLWQRGRTATRKPVTQ